ncbi:hypothetical protein CU098_004301 [Rhizopus stolonifer]|uniref:Protein kinase domain-containing protein n=1 Tax=Rhizopus stolonifer TaxID=4846 RepID=A0A367IVG5_RHIST|nr:hypothetical protein CU098_004301 [Rhizopus stolonifer]
MKPENLLIDYSANRPIIKLADFGLARELNSPPPYTEYVSTRWYRAPEVLLRSTEYSAPVDLWAVGAIFAELITLDPLFPGESEVDQIYRICHVLGSPGNKMGVGQKQKVVRPEERLSPGFARKKTKELDRPDMHTVTTTSTMSPLDGGGEWREGVKLAYKIGFKFPQVQPKPLESIMPNASPSMLDIIRHFLFFNPTQRWSAEIALRHTFFSESDEPVHNVVPMDIEPTTPPDQPLDRHLTSSRGRTLKGITPLDLLTTPKSPYQICPDWNTDHPISRHGRQSSHTTHVDRFLHDVEAVDNNAWLTQSRPIYSSHQKVHPVTDRPNSPHTWKYSYAAHQSYRPSTPVVEHKIAPSSSSKRHSLRANEEGEEVPRRTSAHLLHHNHHPHHNDYHHSHRPTSNNTSFSHDRIPHYGNQLIKWAPPHYHHPTPSTNEDKATETRPQSRQCRTPASFSTNLMKTKHATSMTTANTPTSLTHHSPIKTWTSQTAPPIVNADKAIGHNDQVWTRKSDKPQSTHRNSTLNRFNLWVPENDDSDDQEDNYSNKRWVQVL